MCDICVMNAVKEKMLSRRSFFTATAASGAAAGLGSTSQCDTRHGTTPTTAS